MNADPLYDLAATYRLTRLTTKDSILDTPRDAIVKWAYRNEERYGRIDRDGNMTAAPGGPVPPGQWADYAAHDPQAPKLATLVTCRWCAGIWIAFLVIALRKIAPGPWGWLARALTASAFAALAARLEND